MDLIQFLSTISHRHKTNVELGLADNADANSHNHRWGSHTTKAVNRQRALT